MEREDVKEDNGWNDDVQIGIILPKCGWKEGERRERKGGWRESGWKESGSRDTICKRSADVAGRDRSREI